MRSLFALLIAFVVLAACSKGDHADALPTTKLVIDTRNGPATFTVEVAADAASREKGLMYRTEMAPDAGMLFEFPAPAQEVFWMKDTPLSLDMLFVRADGTISTIVANTVPYSEDRIPASEPVKAVIEINGGRSAALGIQAGNKVHAAFFGNGP
jgi:uncharacterized protein